MQKGSIIRYLGIQIDNSLIWKQKTNYVPIKLYKANDVSQLRQVLNKNI